MLIQGLISGNYPEWDEHHPIHFVGHSAGAQVIRVLQQMLADKVLKFTHFSSIFYFSEFKVLSLSYTLIIF